MMRLTIALTKINDNSSDAQLEIYKKIYAATDIYIDGDYVIIKTDGRPDIPSGVTKAVE